MTIHEAFEEGELPRPRPRLPSRLETDPGRRLADPSLVTADIAALRPYRPGRPWREVAREIGVPESELLMLAANENVLGPSPKALAALGQAGREVNLYPDGGAWALRESLARKHGVTPGHIVVGNGSNELIELLIRTFVGPGETVVTGWPSFVLYRLIPQIYGREALIAPLRDDRYDLAALGALIDHRTKLVFVANPNNPTGTYVPERALMAFLDRLPRSTLLVLDEAYHEFATAPDYPYAMAARPGARVAVLRTFSKAYGLAGARVGYGVMDPGLVHFIDRVRQPYNVSSLAQAAALAALEDDAHLAASVRLVREGRAQLEEGLVRLGLKVVPSQANFLLFRVPGDASGVADALRARGMLVRDMRGYDLPSALRLTVGTPEMNRRVLGAIAAILGR